nr:hypothetical protein [Tanacetum cinerariifolium]
MKRRLEECYDLIENMTAHHNDWDTLAQRSESSSSITSSSDIEIAALKAEMAKINKNLMRVLQVNQQAKAVTSNYETCGAPHSYTDCPATVGQNQNIYVAGAYQGGNSYQPQGASHGPNPPPAYQAPSYQALVHQAPVQQPPIPQPQVFIKMNTTSSLGSGTLPSNTITNPKEDLKGITTCSGNAYQGPMIPTTSSSSPPVVERETEVTKDTMHPTNNESTKDVQPSIVQAETLILNSELVVAPIIEPVAAPKEKFFQDLNFNISFTDALILMPKFGPTIKTLLTNKDKLSELARTPLNEYCSAVLLKKLPVNWGTPANRLISSPVEVAEDVFVKVGTFHFLADFVVVDFNDDPRAPLILGRSFLKTGIALIDVFE